MNFPFSIRLLEERLTLEKKWLLAFQKVGNGKYSEQYSKTNSDNCIHRIKELESVIELLKNNE